MGQLQQLNRKDWEQICDGCARCCMVKLEDENGGEIHYTNVACEFLDLETCRCTVYEDRATRNPECMVLGPDRLGLLKLLPTTCAYRLRDENRSIEQSANQLSIRGKAVSERYIHPDQLPDHIVEWISTD